jgi:CheY-like chemotaxis protein
MAKKNITLAGATEGSPVVLVATPVPADRAFFSELLAGAGYEVALAVDGQDALRKVVLCWPALIVLELDLPLLSGREFLRIRSEYERLTLIPVIVIADDSPHPEVDAVVARPFAPEQVLADVRRLTGFLKQTA